MSTLDIIIIISYLLGIVAFGLWSVRKDKANTDDYFLASHSLKWPVIGAALFATNISSIHIVGLAEAGFASGLIVESFKGFGDLWAATFAARQTTQFSGEQADLGAEWTRRFQKFASNYYLRTNNNETQRFVRFLNRT